MRGTKKLVELLLCLALSSLYVGSGAVADSVDYLDDERHIAAKDCLILTDQTDWGMSDETHWYAVQGSVTIGDRITVSVNVNLILADGAVLEAGKGVELRSGDSLTIWGQKEGNGCLNATGGDLDPGIGSGSVDAGRIAVMGGVVHAIGEETNGIGGGNGSLRIAGGNVTAEGRSVGHGVSFSRGEVIVEGGKLTATGGDLSCGLSARSLRVLGGSIEALAGTFSYGITCIEEIRISGGTVVAKTEDRSVAVECEDGEIIITGGNVDARCGTGSGSCGILGERITLSWTRLTDSIYADSYQGEIHLKSRFLLKDTATDVTEKNIEGNTIVPDRSEWIWTFALPEGVTSIGDDAFAGIAAARVYLPDSCRSIGAHAFAGCTALERIRIPWGIPYNRIAPDAFNGVDHVVLVGMKGGGAEQYAKEHANCEFEEE